MERLPSEKKFTTAKIFYTKFINHTLFQPSVRGKKINVLLDILWGGILLYIEIKVRNNEKNIM